MPKFLATGVAYVVRRHPRLQEVANFFIFLISADVYLYVRKRCTSPVDNAITDTSLRRAVAGSRSVKRV